MAGTTPDPVTLALHQRFSYVRVVSRRDGATAIGVSRAPSPTPAVQCDGRDVSDALAGLLAMHRQVQGGGPDA